MVSMIGTYLRFALPRLAWLALALALAVSACAPQIARLGVENRAPAIEGDRFVTRDGLRLGLSHWDAEHPRAVIVALHGMNDYSHAFALPALWWAAQGISTYAYDTRGFGRSPNSGLWPSARVMRQDLVDFVAVMRARNPNVRVVVLGESMGGALAMTAFASDTPPAADGLILVTPAVWGSAAMPLSYRLTLWTVAHTARWWALTGRGLNIRATDNDAVLRELGRDPLALKETRADTLYGLVHLMGEARDAAPKLARVRMLLMYGGKDQVIPRAATEDVIRNIGPSVTVKFYPDGYHMLLRDRAGPQRWPDVATWVKEIAVPGGDGNSARLVHWQ